MSRRLPLPLLVIFLSLLLCCFCPPSSSLTVHLVPHSHDDVGWLSTVDQYYIDHVQHILTSVVQALKRVPDRKFVYVEQAYFQRWWRQQSDDIRQLTRRLVHSGQLEFANGGWCMHDEATTHFVDMIDQTTLGHQAIVEEFGMQANPTVGWQLDPFGHSSTQASLLGAGVGFNALFFGRIDYQDHDLRVLNKSLQFNWYPSSSSQQGSSGLYTEASLDGNYNPPDGLCWDPLCNPFGGGPSDAVQDRDDLSDNNVAAFVDLFIRRAYEMAAVHRGDLATMNVMWLMGSDFMYEGAETWMINLDRIIRAVNRNGTVHTRYSTPSEYVQAKLAEGVQHPVKTDDFFPYLSDPQNAWVGYFTTRPGLKGYVRSSSQLLQTARQVEVTSGGDGSATARLWEALSLAQHHDSITGTELDWVADDYAQRIAAGAAEAYTLLESELSGAAQGHYFSCPLLNLSVCEVLRTPSSTDYTVLLYNPQPRQASTVVHLPVFAQTIPTSSVQVKNSEGKSIVADLYALSPTSAFTNLSATAATSFLATVPGLGYSAYSISLTSYPSLRHLRTTSPAVEINGTSIENARIRLEFDATTGLMSSWTDKASGRRHSFGQQFYWYESSNTSSVGCSNNYYFKPQPNTTLRVLEPSAPQLTVRRGRVVTSVVQRWNEWLQQTWRLYTAEGVDDVQGGQVEVEWTVGPIAIDDGRSKEVVAKYTTDLHSDGVLFTDSNGREYQRRVKDHRPTWNWTNVSPVAGQRSSLIVVSCFHLTRPITSMLTPSPLCCPPFAV
jgi:hypothetical protein